MFETAPSDVPGNEFVEALLLLSALRPEAYLPAHARLLSHPTGQGPGFEAQVRELLHASPVDLKRLGDYAVRQGLRVLSSAPEVGLRLAGAAGDLLRAFSHLPVLFHNEGHEGDATRFPVALEGSVVALLTSLERGLEMQPQIAALGHPAVGTPLFTAPSLARAYAFPPGGRGEGVKVGIILQGGGFADYGLGTYFTRLGLMRPDIRVVEVSHARNQPASYAEISTLLLLMGVAKRGPPVPPDTAWDLEGGAPRSFFDSDDLLRLALEHGFSLNAIRWTIEGLMDVELLAGVANGVSVTFYITPNTTLGLRDAITRAAEDGVTVLSCSFSTPESLWKTTERSRHIIDRALLYALQKGVTVCFSSGNAGSGPKGSTSPQVNYPSSSPWVLCCGGTQFPQLTDLSVEEQVWKESAGKRQAASGGGYSAFYPRPSWQTNGDGAQRGLPDVSSNAAYSSGVWLWIAPDDRPHGINTCSAGTSASAPLWAGLVAVLSGELGRRLGFLTPRLYQPEVRQTMRPILWGNNIISDELDVYVASPGWNACTGLGRPVGEALLTVLGK